MTANNTRHPVEDMGVSNREEVAQEPIGRCEQCNTVIFLGEAKTVSYAGFNGERVLLAFCEDCAGDRK